FVPLAVGTQDRPRRGDQPIMDAPDVELRSLLGRELLPEPGEPFGLLLTARHIGDERVVRAAERIHGVHRAAFRLGQRLEFFVGEAVGWYGFARHRHIAPSGGGASPNFASTRSASSKSASPSATAFAPSISRRRMNRSMNSPLAISAERASNVLFSAADAHAPTPPSTPSSPL